MGSIIKEIEKHPKPYDLGQWWADERDRDPTSWSEPLEADELRYIEVFSAPNMEPIMRFRGTVSPSSLTDDEKEKAKDVFGDGATALSRYCNRENRRRIVAHYVYHHPATVNYELELYRMSRDANPVAFSFERGWQMVRGEEIFTHSAVSRLTAAAELVIPMLIGAGISKIFRNNIPVPKGLPVRALTDPIYDLPAEGGGMRINGRWYTEHALERMAPDTPQIRAELRQRVLKRLERLGLKPATSAYKRVFDTQMRKVDPRGIPPSVVEAEIHKPGSTNVKVITAKHGNVVVTVMPR